jgi:hypothetical protein
MDFDCDRERDPILAETPSDGIPSVAFAAPPARHRARRDEDAGALAAYLGAIGQLEVLPPEEATLSPRPWSARSTHFARP